jgi:succinate dehydrogenase/fumarate reductase flavoprotein subunit
LGTGRFDTALPVRILETDVVVVGGGAAGCFAALQLKQLGIRPLIMCKGMVGKSGASIFAGNLVLSGRLLGNSPEQARDTAEFLIKYHNQFLIDQNWTRRCGAWIESTYYAELEQAGLYFRRDDNGTVVTSPGRIRSIAANVQGNSGVPFMDLRRKQVARAGIDRLEETVATALLQRADGSVSGVVGLDYIRGTYIVVCARAVVLASGYSDRLYRRSTGTREMSADGLVMAWRVGASMVNLEMQWWHTNDVAAPPSWQRMQVYPNPLLGSDKSARMLNKVGTAFFDQQRDDPLAFGPYTVQLKALVREVRAGRARYDGGYFASFDHCDPVDLDAYTTYGKPFRQLGLDPARDRLETAVTAHYRQGGVWVEPDTLRTTVPGLYAVGGLAGHHNGLIALVTYDGHVVSKSIAQDIADLQMGSLQRAQVEAEVQRLDQLRCPDLDHRGIRPSFVRRAIQHSMSENVGVEKDAASLAQALDDLADIRSSLLPNMRLSNVTACVNFEWLDAIEVVNMAEACELVVHSSLERRESRGPFMRRDFPLTDNNDWLAANILRRGGSGELRFERRPYETPFFTPGFATQDNMEVAW